MDEWEKKATENRESFLKVDRREERIGFLKKWGKEIPGWLFKPGMGKAAQPVDPMAEPLPPEYVAVDGRRFLVMRGVGGTNVMIVDAHGTCDALKPDGKKAQNHVSPDWHRYWFRPSLTKPPAPPAHYTKAPYFLAIRCPNSLTQDEWKRVFTDQATAVAWGKDNPLGKKVTKTEDWLEES